MLPPNLLSRIISALELGLDPACKTLLIMSGGAGLGDSLKLAERLLNMEGKFQIVALTGRNERQLKKLKSLAAQYPGRLLADRVHQHDRASHGRQRPGHHQTWRADLIGMPGAMGLPMVIISPIPGQEDRIADYLLEQGAALKACDVNAVAWRVNMLLNEPEQLSGADGP